MKKLIPLAMAVFLVSCATPLPKEKRELTFVETTTASKSDAYNRVLSYLAKNLGDSNAAIKVKDQENGTIITQIILPCNDFRTFMDINPYTAEYNLEVNAKDKKVRLVYEAVAKRGHNAVSGSAFNPQPITSDSEAQAAKKCATEHKAALLKEISVTASKADW
mgnify:CR=1 FL=1